MSTEFVGKQQNHKICLDSLQLKFTVIITVQEFMLLPLFICYIIVTSFSNEKKTEMLNQLMRNVTSALLFVCLQIYSMCYI